MKIKPVLHYLSAMDIHHDATMQEAAVYFEHGLDPNTSLVFDLDRSGVSEILKIRSHSTIRATGAIACRIIGIDAIYRIATHTDFPS